MLYTVMYIHIDSADNLNSGDDNADVLIEVNENVKINEVTPVYLHSFEIPNSFYNVNSGNNAVSLDSTVVNITAGSYTLTDLMSQIETDFNASNSDTFSVSFSNTTGFITILDSTSNYTLDFDVDNSIADLLGFSRSATYSSAATYTGSRVPNLTDKIYIHIEELTSPYNTSNNSHPVFIVDNDQARHDIVYYKPDYKGQKKCDAKQPFKMMHIRLRDRFGNTLENCPQWQMTLEIS